MKQSRLVGAISLVIAQAVVLLLGYITHPWVARVLGPGPYGIYGIVLSIQTIAGMILTLGIPSAVSRFTAQGEEYAQSTLRQALRIQLVVALSVAGLTAGIAPLLAQLLGDATLTRYIVFIAGVIFLQAFFQVFVQFLAGMHHFRKQAALTSLYAIIKLLAAISLIYVLGIFGAFASFAIGGVIAAIIGWYWTRGIGGTHDRRLPIKAFLSFAGTYVVILIGLQILISLDLFMVKAFLRDDVQAGFYNAAVTLSRIPYLLLQGLAFILLPSISALTRPGASRFEATLFIRDTLRYLIALIIQASALAAATSENLLILFFSRQYAQAAAPLTILMVGLSALSFYLLLVNIVAGAGKAKAGLLTTAGMLSASAVLGAYLVPRWGLLGAAWQTASVSLLGLLVLTAYTFKTFRLPLPLRSTINVVIGTIIAVSITYFWPASPALLVPQYVVAFLLYGLTLIVLGEFTPVDRQRLAALHPRLKFLTPK
ncbi:MAG TPA: oligosaccharide flippase family protein [Candidatus Andersenbacteria bacterium]|nr:oligosaccharide flippase family protein [Candidatus Andersenbacteria bacterium]